MLLKEKNVEARTNFRGSEESYNSVKKQILERFGPELAAQYNPYTNCMTYNQWRINNCQVKEKERGFVSTVIVEKKDKNGQVSKYPKKIVLFFENQVSKLNQEKPC